MFRNFYFCEVRLIIYHLYNLTFCFIVLIIPINNWLRYFTSLHITVDVTLLGTPSTKISLIHIRNILLYVLLLCIMLITNFRDAVFKLFYHSYME